MDKVNIGKDKETGKDKLQIFQPLDKRKLEAERILKRYPKIFRQKSLPLTQTCMCWGLDCGQGWFWLIDNLCGGIQSYIDNNAKYNPEITQVEASQVKEKFGSLRFYTNGECEKISGMIWLAEYLSYYICEDCGSTNNVTQNEKGWIRSLCPKCRKEDKKTGAFEL